MKASPSLTARALAMHNAVLRKAAVDNAGQVIEQEGDSWAVAFHDASDAMAFCMQAQQALHKVDWPLGLTGGGDPDALNKSVTADGPQSLGSGASLKSRGMLRQLLGVGSLGMMSQRSSTASGASWLFGSHNQLELGHMPNSMFMRGISNASVDTGSSAGGNGFDRAGSQQLGEVIVLSGAGESGDQGALATKDDVESVGAHSSDKHSSFSDSLRHNSGTLPTVESAPFSSSNKGAGTGASGTSRQGSGSARRLFRLKTGRVMSAQERLFRGLRVRMGAASGVLPPGVDVRSSGVFELAKGAFWVC